MCRTVCGKSSIVRLNDPRYYGIDIDVYIYARMCTYLWRVLFQNMISELGIGITTSIFGLALNTFWKRAPHIYIYIYYTMQFDSYEWAEIGMSYIWIELSRSLLFNWYDDIEIYETLRASLKPIYVHKVLICMLYKCVVISLFQYKLLYAKCPSITSCCMVE